MTERPPSINESPTRASTPPQVPGYDVFDELGRGGTSVVYRAHHQSLARPVALKFVLDPAHADAEARARFQREARSIARLQHPGIVQIFAVGEYEDRPFMALELIDGGGLHRHVGDTPQPPLWCAALVAHLARTIEYCHQHGIVHRDLKPANILVYAAEDRADNAPTCGEGSQVPAPPIVKITDFGLARDLAEDSDLTRTGLPMGTPAYMAPEQAAGRVADADERADIYALGTVLYRLLTGRPPFSSDDPLRTMQKVLNDDPVAPGEVQSGIPADLETICLRCMMKVPEARYQSAEALADDLQQFLLGEPIAARALTSFEKLQRWVVRKPIVALTFFGFGAFYLLHLALAMMGDPLHSGTFHWYVTGVAAVGFAAGPLLQQLRDAGRAQVLTSISLIALPVLAATAAFAFDRGPLSAPVAVYVPMIGVAALALPTARMIWITTALISCCYLTLVLIAELYQPANRASVEQVLAFCLTLVTMGLVTHLLVRRLGR
ncbi:MAG: serine/threonine-protein kinase [Pseudomonadota bacterium]